MRRLIIISAFLLAATICFGQKRTYIHKGSSGNDIYVTESGGQLEAYFQLDILSPTDSLFLLVTKENAQEIHDYMVSLLDLYHRWSRTAKRNHVVNFKKAVDIESPLIRFFWVEKKKGTSFIDPARVFALYSTEGRWLVPEFKVYENGRCTLYVDLNLPSEDYRYKGRYSTWFLLHDADINRIIRWTDYDALERAYKRKKPKLTNAEINALFD